MIVRFSASNSVAMIFFIPLLLALGIILAVIVPLIALIITAVSILFLGLYAFAKIGLVKKQQIGNGNSSDNSSERGKKASAIDVKDYKVR